MNANNNNNQNIQNNSNIKNDQERTNIHNSIDLDLETKNYNDSILKQYDQNNLLNQENNLTNFRVNFYNKEKHFPNNSISNKNTSNIQVRSSSHNNNSSDISKKQPYYSKMTLIIFQNSVSRLARHIHGAVELTQGFHARRCLDRTPLFCANCVTPVGLRTCPTVLDLLDARDESVPSVLTYHL